MLDKIFVLVFLLSIVQCSIVKPKENHTNRTSIYFGSGFINESVKMTIDGFKFNFVNISSDDVLGVDFNNYIECINGTIIFHSKEDSIKKYKLVLKENIEIKCEYRGSEYDYVINRKLGEFIMFYQDLNKLFYKQQEQPFSLE